MSATDLLRIKYTSKALNDIGNDAIDKLFEREFPSSDSIAQWDLQQEFKRDRQG